METSFIDLVGSQEVAGLLSTDQNALNRELSSLAPTLDAAVARLVVEDSANKYFALLACLEPDLTHQASEAMSTGFGSTCLCKTPLA